MTRSTFILVALALTTALPATATTYKFKITPGANGSALRYYDLNSKQQIIAETYPASGNPTCALLHLKASTPIFDPNGSIT